MTDTVWPAALDLLADDPAFGPVVERVGPVRMSPPARTHFRALVRAIVYQQLAGAAARTIHGRVEDALEGQIEPAAVLRTPEKVLRGAGLSGSKLKAIRDLSEKVKSGAVPLEALEGLSDDAVVDALTEVWGIGVWTARMFLLGQLRRPDVWPTGDLGVRAGWARIHGLEETPSATELDPLGEPYRPWRSAAAWYCWRATETVAPGA